MEGPLARRDLQHEGEGTSSMEGISSMDGTNEGTSSMEVPRGHATAYMRMTLMYSVCTGNIERSAIQNVFCSENWPQGGTTILEVPARGTSESPLHREPQRARAHATHYTYMLE